MKSGNHSAQHHGNGVPGNPRRGAKWNPQIVVTTLRRLHRNGDDLSTRRLRVSHSALHAAAVHWYGSFRAAIEAAGIPYQKVRKQDPHRWSKKNVIQELRRLYDQGTPLHHAAMDRQRPELVTAAYRYFGAYHKAVTAAGIPYTKVRIRPARTWDSQRVLKTLRQLKREKSGLWSNAVRRRQPYLTRVARQLFGSYRNAAKAAGVEAAALVPPDFRIWSDDKVLEELRQMYDAQKRLNPSHVQATRPYLFHVSRRRFGSYRKAVTAAGIEYGSVARIISKPMTREMVIERLRAMYDRSVDMRYSALERSDARLLEAARGRFGSYRLACKAAGLDYPPLVPLKHWTERLVLKTLRELNADGADLRFGPMKRKRLPLFQAAKYYFGSYANAVRVAGIDYDEVVQRQLQRRQLRRGSPSGAGRRAAVIA